jgi:hypothetical protein
MSIKKNLYELIVSSLGDRDELEWNDEIISREAAESLLESIELEVQIDDLDTIILNSDVTVLSTVSDWLGHLYYVSSVVAEMFNDLIMLRSELSEISSLVSLPVVLAYRKRDFTRLVASLYKSLDVFANPMIIADGRSDTDVKNMVQSSIVRIANFLALLDFYLRHRNSVESLEKPADVHNVFVSLAYYLVNMLNDTIRSICSNFFFDLSKMPVMLESTSSVISVHGDKVPMVPFALVVKRLLSFFGVSGSVMALAHIRRVGLSKKSLSDEAVANILREISQDVLNAVRAASGEGSSTPAEGNVGDTERDKEGISAS